MGGVQGVSAERIVLKNNYVYNSPGAASAKNNGIRLGYEDKNNRDVKVLDNYIVSSRPVRLWWWQSVEFLGNTIYSQREALDRFTTLTRFDQLGAVHAGIAAAQRAYQRLKIDTVVIRGVNDDELVPLIEYGRSVGAEVRFIAPEIAPPRLVASSSLVSTQVVGCAAAKRVTASSIAPACAAADNTKVVSIRLLTDASVASSCSRRGSRGLRPAVSISTRRLSWRCSSAPATSAAPSIA